MKDLMCWILGMIVGGVIILLVDDFFLLSLAAIVYAIPLFIIVETVYVASSLALKRKIRLVLSWVDCPTIVLSIALWGCLVEKMPWGVSNKSLANLIEPGLFSALACVFYAIRCYYALTGNNGKMKAWERVSFVAIPVVAVLMAFLFPCLPE